MDIISLKCDYCFKEWFSNETIRRYFISDVLDIPIEDIRSVRRSLFYLAKMYTEDLKVGEKYSKLKRCVCISFLDYDYTKGEDYHSVYRLRDTEGNEFSDVFEVHIIELGKKLKGTEKVDDWIRLINAKNTEDLSMIQTKNMGIKTAIEEMKRMSLSKRLRLHYEAYLKDKRDAWAIADYQEQKHKKEMEEAVKQGLAEGMEQGIEKGEQKLALLNKALLEDHRIADLQRALEDAEYRETLYREYGI